jgi:hypothetical protein
MRWSVGSDHIVRAEKEGVRVEIGLVSNRTRYRISIYDGGGLVGKYGPYIQLPRAKKAAEDHVRRLLSAKEEA